MGTAGPRERPAAPMLSPRFAGSLPQALAGQGRTRGPRGPPPALGLRTDRHSGAPAQYSGARVTHTRLQCPARGAPHCWRTPPSRGSLACPGVPAADGDGTRPPRTESSACPAGLPRAQARGRLPRKQVSLLPQLQRLQRAPRPPAQSPRQDGACVCCQLPTRPLWSLPRARQAPGVRCALGTGRGEGGVTPWAGPGGADGLGGALLTPP